MSKTWSEVQHKHSGPWYLSNKSKYIVGPETRKHFLSSDLTEMLFNNDVNYEEFRLYFTKITQLLIVRLVCTSCVSCKIASNVHTNRVFGSVSVCLGSAQLLTELILKLLLFPFSLSPHQCKNDWCVTPAGIFHRHVWNIDEYF